MPQETHEPSSDSDHAGPIIRLVDLWKSFAAVQVLKGISIDFPRGRSTVVLGPSGCGKSVMLKHIPGLLRPDRGEVWFDGRTIHSLRENQLGPIRREIGFLFQQSALFDSMNVERNVSFPLIEHTRMSRSEVRHRVEEVLEQVGLPKVMQKMPSELSGGQRKRVALARAIVLRPKVILYDEPTTGLDPIRADSINDLIIKLQTELNVTSIVVTHDLTSAFKVADRMVMLHEGRIVTQGPPDMLRQSDDPYVQQFLEGRSDESGLQSAVEPAVISIETETRADHEQRAPRKDS
ncbi:MAG: ABC transporter ATP-binding protein [Phycisphaerales bacterium]|nr:MAG: ABC transporter ATP-binding protein [Phycisphaerales bacterium]